MVETLPQDKEEGPEALAALPGCYAGPKPPSAIMVIGRKMSGFFLCDIYKSWTC